MGWQSINYGIDNWKYGYRGAFTEYLAYEREDALFDWLSKNTEFLNVISNPFNLVGERMSNFAAKEGRRFRYEAGIDAEIRFFQYAESTLRSEINEAKGPLGGYGGSLNLDSLRSQLDEVLQSIQRLNNEKGELAKEFDGTKNP